MKLFNKSHLITTDVYDVAVYKMLGARMLGIEGVYPKLTFHLEITNWQELYIKHIGIIPYKRFKNVRERLKNKYKESKFKQDVGRKRLNENLDLLKGAITESILKEITVDRSVVMQTVGRVLKSYENKLYLKDTKLS